MATLRPSFLGEYSATRQKAIQEARSVQAAIVKECADAGKEPPPYQLLELIGKGSFGRVYKATSVGSRQAVAVKVLSIDDGDSLRPGTFDTFSEILKEVNTLKLLSDGGAKNINTVIDTLLVGPTIWIITEYCAGGSLSTLMRPTGGLAEKWIIPILREVAEAVYWVHEQGVIHRDIKCANVLIMEDGGVQLCDFGVAGLIETRFDKRTTVTGTLQWMAPELFDSTVSYGSEVDIWAFGSMAYEMATGLPPNAGQIADLSGFGSYLKQHCPRLTGDQYSAQLQDLVAFCLVENPAQRPHIEQVQQHPYIHDSSDDYPTISLSKLVNAYKVWEIQGGSRRSLFTAGGAQGPANDCSPAGTPDDEWNFSATDEGADVSDSDAQALFDVYGPGVDLPGRQDQRQAHRRRPPNMKPFKVPLEKVFDPHTISNYDDNARAFYSRSGQSSPSDLPLRNNSEQPTIRESLIDLDLSLDGGDLSQFADVETIRPAARPATSHPEDLDRRRTQDWTFPSMTPASANPDFATFELNHDPQPLGFSQDSTPAYPQFDYADSQPMDYMPPTGNMNRLSSVSLIDLDASLAIDTMDISRPSTSSSDAVSTSSDFKAPFDLEQHAVHSGLALSTREPSVYVSEDLYASSPTKTHDSSPPPQMISLDLVGDRGRPRIPPSCPLPLPPSASVMQAYSSPEETREELRRMISSLHEHLQLANHVLVGLCPFVPKGH
ncbi:serine/threonine protein kinase [Parathielavia hyrcaniae]|uniref:non-specific serine/threonine protein kinase n=1 Tax=Parathielavia hyrcaniae TaxID=113614 RepID=A0AAN6Q1J1_9PEZI|nr:serine/threonine protein kinase [Parathielavia hyrcaniae]